MGPATFSCQSGCSSSLALSEGWRYRGDYEGPVAEDLVRGFGQKSRVDASRVGDDGAFESAQQFVQVLLLAGKHLVHAPILPLREDYPSAMNHPLAASANQISELFKDPALTVACVLLIVVSIGWVVVSRMIVHKLKRAAQRGQHIARREVVQKPRDIWAFPPEA
jgi:hypothetical protein